jgi:hypothetical protein
MYIEGTRKGEKRSRKKPGSAPMRHTYRLGVCYPIGQSPTEREDVADPIFWVAFVFVFAGDGFALRLEKA